VLRVSLEDYLRSGVFGVLQLGVPREEMRRLFGEPDHIGGASRRQRTPTILKYGDIEFLYRPGEDYLWGIYMDGFGVPQGGPKIDLDPWIIRGGMAADTIEHALISAEISFQKSRTVHDPTITIITTMGGVELGIVEKVDSHDSCYDIVGLHHIAKHL